ncbi:hypothetical protein MUG87_04650 [Ectobacillus sp. JY-23]|uniref:isoprenylcysteine carboxyl methyltransferase family protein n=1 Tax=Ectobacillus sp. JY-23 TaxID=2933872 RepID=UPI001FF2DD20|nr:isoprenylcysteine carboxylmethyltransferase family protein [Ectobacillus sp. JY-23]UOY93418.1 hypothetical protein MUG87_04650 [Ectobacillus sp. JY-23]
MSFVVFFIFIVLQRVGELVIAKKNERHMKERGALEFGQAHYTYMVLMHVSFLLCTVTEVIWLHKSPSRLWPMLLCIFIITQILRIWAISSLGVYWNTKIIVLPGATVVKKGPYRFIRHPNYLVVIVEILVIPLLFQAYITTFLFTALNIAMLRVRIKEEEKALVESTTYQNEFNEISRFTP